MHLQRLGYTISAPELKRENQFEAYLDQCQAKAILLSMLPPQIWCQVEALQTPLDIWVFLKEKFSNQRGDDQNLAVLTGQFYNLKCNPSWSTSQWIEKINHLVMQMELMKKGPEDSAKLHVLIKTLPNKIVYTCHGVTLNSKYNI